MSPRTKEQNELIRKEKSDRIKQAALTCFADHGFSGASIAEIAKKAGISKGLIYNYFKGKDDILHELIQDLFEEIYSKFAFPEGGDMEDHHMAQFIEVSIDLVTEDPDRYKLYFGLFTQPKVMDFYKDDMMKQLSPMINMFLNYYKNKGYENPMAMMRFVSAAIDGIQMHIMLDAENFPTEDIKKIAIQSFVHTKSIS